MSIKKTTVSTVDMMPRSRAVMGLVQEDWSRFSRMCNRRWDTIFKDLLPSRLSKKDILGSGYFGVVIKTSNPKLVIKITTDNDEGYFNQIVLNDDTLRLNVGLPYVFDCFSVPEWDAFIILRENVRYGLTTLPKSAPLSRAIPVLDQFGSDTLSIESKVANIMNALYEIDGRFSKSDFEYAFREAQGQIRTLIVKTLKKLPTTSESSKYFHAMQVIEHSLDKYGIALWDLHEGNLGTHQYDMSDLAPDAPPLDKTSIIILDVGGNFGTPIMTDSIDEI